MTTLLSPPRRRPRTATETLRYAIGPSDLGTLLVAMSAKGVCAILLGDDPAALVQDLQDRFPKADCRADQDPALKALWDQVAHLVREPRTQLALPLDVRGTAFQQRVWAALRQVPAGQTLTYRELATRIGSPAAVRAVAGACAANPLALVIPCHRVIRLNGELSGYRWGRERKRALLDWEGRSVEG